MRTESEEREVVEGGEPVLPPAEEARKPDPCTEVSMKAILMLSEVERCLTLMATQVVSGLTVKIADLGNACWVRVVPPHYFDLKN